jgi:hypothetical protein
LSANDNYQSRNEAENLVLQVSPTNRVVDSPSPKRNPLKTRSLSVTLHQQGFLLSADYYKNAVIDDFEKWQESFIYYHQRPRNAARKT